MSRTCRDGCGADVGPYPGSGLREIRCHECAKERERVLARARYSSEKRHMKHERAKGQKVPVQSDWWDHKKEAGLLRRELAANMIEEAQVWGCIDCGEEDELVLQFDHVRGVKARNVTRTMALGDLHAEIEKCEVRCANCHVRRHKLEGVAP